MLLKGIKFFMILGLALTAPSYCHVEADDMDIGIASGTISSLDWVGSRMVIDRIVDLAHDQLTFTVPGSTKITRGSESIMFSDLHMWDRVKVEYYNDAPTGGLKTISIRVLQ